MFSPSKEDLLGVLSHAVWKTGHEIMQELRERRGVPRGGASFSDGDLNYGSLYINLRRLVEDGLVERRSRTTIPDEELRDLGGKYPPEFKLTETGLRHRFENRTVEGGMVPFPRPQEAQ